MIPAERRPGRDSDGTLRPWEVPGNLRRDFAPHRSVLLAVLGAISLVCGFASQFLTYPAVLALPRGIMIAALFIAIPAAVSVPLGIVVARLAGHDLHRMRCGEMDPEGRRLAVLAQLWGIVGALLSLLCWAPFAWFCLAIP
jgi:hypothetical protein